METQLEEANEVAKSSNQKFEDANRKLKVRYTFVSPNLIKFVRKIQILVSLSDLKN